MSSPDEESVVVDLAVSHQLRPTAHDDKELDNPEAPDTDEAKEKEKPSVMGNKKKGKKEEKKEVEGREDHEKERKTEEKEKLQMKEKKKEKQEEKKKKHDEEEGKKKDDKSREAKDKDHCKGKEKEKDDASKKKKKKGGRDDEDSEVEFERDLSPLLIFKEMIPAFISGKSADYFQSQTEKGLAIPMLVLFYLSRLFNSVLTLLITFTIVSTATTFSDPSTNYTLYVQDRLAGVPGLCEANETSCIGGNMTAMEPPSPSDEKKQQDLLKLTVTLILPMIYLLVYIVDGVVSERRDRQFVDLIGSSTLPHLSTKDEKFSTGPFFSRSYAAWIFILNLLELGLSAALFGLLVKNFSDAYLNIIIWFLAGLEALLTCVSEVVRLCLYGRPNIPIKETWGNNEVKKSYLSKKKAVLDRKVSFMSYVLARQDLKYSESSITYVNRGWDFFEILSIDARLEEFAKNYQKLVSSFLWSWYGVVKTLREKGRISVAYPFPAGDKYPKTELSEFTLDLYVLYDLFQSLADSLGELKDAMTTEETTKYHERWFEIMGGSLARLQQILYGQFEVEEREVGCCKKEKRIKGVDMFSWELASQGLLGWFQLQKGVSSGVLDDKFPRDISDWTSNTNGGEVKKIYDELLKGKERRQLLKTKYRKAAVSSTDELAANSSVVQPEISNLDSGSVSSAAVAPPPSPARLAHPNKSAQLPSVAGWRHE